MRRYQSGNYPVLLFNGMVAVVWHQRRSGRNLAVTVDWLYRHADDFTFTIRPGPGQVRFSHLGIQDYLRKRRR